MAEEWVEYDGGVVQDWHRNASQIRVASGVTVIPQFAFDSCNLRAVDLSNVTTISDFAFDACHSLEHIGWSTASAVEIGRCAFYRCEQLREIDLSNVTKVGVQAFAGCNALERVSTPSSVTRIEDFAFEKCVSVMEVELGEGMQRIGKGVFWGCSSLARITIPASVTNIESEAFCGCSELAEVELNEGLQTIGEKAFYRCDKLLRISIPSTALKVGEGAFAQCFQLGNADLLEGLQMIGADAFRNCYSLERIGIPSSAKSVGSRAFQSCSNLSEVTLREGIHYIDSDAFIYCPSRHINIPPTAFVVESGGSNCQLVRSRMPAVRRERRLVVSKWMKYRGQGQLAQAEAKVNEILGRHQQREEEKIQSIREWFAYYDRLDVTTMLELAIWRCNVDENEQDAETRKASRESCGSDMNIIIPGVLPFLEL